MNESTPRLLKIQGSNKNILVRAAEGVSWSQGIKPIVLLLVAVAGPVLAADPADAEYFRQWPQWLGQPILPRSFGHVYCLEEEGQADETGPAEALRRGLSFLASEVPSWRQENKCYSCHNNGDAARALFMAQRLGYHIKAEALDDTTAWLERPHQWKQNGGQGEFNDKKLATLQFSAALAEAARAGRIDGKRPLRQAAQMVADLQQPNGSWRVNVAGTTGGPVNYGDALATALALQVLRQSDLACFNPHVEKGEGWLRRQTPKNVLTAASLLIGLHTANDRTANDKTTARQRTKCLALIAAGQKDSGGWGPFVHSTPEPFDTAIVLLALATLDDGAKQALMIQQGQQYLANIQYDDGSWPETTRPSNSVSYAQRLSTAGWATQALLATLPKPASNRKSTPHPTPSSN